MVSDDICFVEQGIQEGQHRPTAPTMKNEKRTSSMTEEQEREHAARMAQQRQANPPRTSDGDKDAFSAVYLRCVGVGMI